MKKVKCQKILIALCLLFVGIQSSTSQVYTGFKELYTQQEVNDFGSFGYISVTQGLYIRNSTDIIDLTPLSSITSVGGLTIYENGVLTDLTGLHNITQITGYLNQGLDITRNNLLPNLNGLSGITTIPDRLYIEGNPALKTLDGLSVTQVNQLIIQDNNTLENLNGLGNLLTVIADINLVNNSLLNDLSALNTVTSSGIILVANNNSLQKIDGFNSLIAIPPSIGISENPILSDFCGLKNFATANPTYLNFGATNNIYNPTIAQVISACDGSAPQTFPIDLSFESYLIAQGIDSNPIADNAISFVDAAKTDLANKVLNLNGLDIKNLNGIENFTFLEEISINGGSLGLTDMDFSGNKFLKIINTNIPNLSSLIINGADALETIRVGPTQLTTLNLSNNLELKSLSIYGSSLSSINVLANAKLESFVLDDTNTLTSDIDFTNNNELSTVVFLNSSLMNLELKDKPNLSYIDFTSSSFASILLDNLPILNTNTNFANSSIVNLKVENTGIQSLDVSLVNNLEVLNVRYNRALDNLPLPPVNSPLRELTLFASFFFDDDPNTQFNYSISDRVNLQKIEVWESGITNLFIENCPALNDLIIGEHLGIYAELQNITIKNTAISSFYLADNNKELLNIEIENNSNLTTIGSSSIGLESIERLSVVNNNLNQLNIERLNNLETLSVRSNPNLAVLDLTSINLGGANSLITFEGENTGITNLDFSTSSNIEVVRLNYDSNFGGVPLTSLNLKNGNNAGISELNTTGNYPSLSCIQVDNVIAAETATTNGDWVKDVAASYSTNCAAAITLIDDANFEAYLASQGWDNNPTAGQVFTADIATLTTLNISGQVIGNIIGIEDFAALETLDVSNNNLVDLLLINNTNLITVNASNNNISGTINFGSTALEDLNLSSNQITTIGGLGGVPNLKIFNISNNPTLGSINFNGAPNIEEINIEESPSLGTLSNLSILSSLKEFSLSQSLLTSIDFTSNSSLELLDIFDNSSLQSITISQGSNPNLQRASFPRNNLASLGVTGMASITSIDVSDNPLTVLEVTSLTNLEQLTTYRSGITDLDLSNNEYITDLTLGIVGGTVDRSNLVRLDLNGAVSFTYTNINLSTDNNPDLVCIEVQSIFDATEAVNQGYWSTDDSLFSLNCAAQLQTISFVQDLTDFEGNFNPTPQLVINGEITTASSITVTDITSSYSNTNVSTVNSDYTFNNGSDIVIPISPGTYTSATTIDISGLFIQDDTVYEGNEFLVLELINPTGDLTLTGSTTIFQYNILEDDYIVEIIGLQDAVEGGTNGQFQFNLLDDNGQTVINETGAALEIDFLDEGNAIRGTDYSITGGDIANGASTGIINIIAVNDGVVEGNEEVRIDVQDGIAYNINAPEMYSIDIIDNNGGGATFEAEVVVITDIQNTLNINEGNRDIEIQMSIPNADTENLIVEFDIEVIGVSATAGSDFTVVTANEIFMYEYSNDGLTIYTIGILDDAMLEGNEELLIRISNPSDSRVTLKNANANGNLEFTVTIIDNDSSGNNDADNDGVLDNVDNCPNTANADQANLDGDTFGDVCDNDIDGDGVNNINDAFPMDDSETVDSDADGIGDNADTDDDNDGVIDANDNCPNTPLGTMVGADGCEVTGTTTSPDIETGDISVLSQNQSCPGVASGEIFVFIRKDYTYNVKVTSTMLSSPLTRELIYSENEILLLNKLNPGIYQVCVTIPEYPDFEQCFNVNVQSLESITIQGQGVNLSEQLVSYNVQGSTSYSVRVNDNTYSYEFTTTTSKNIKIPLKKGKNNVQITGVSDCQGIFTDEIVIGHITAYPNPVIEKLHLNGLLATNTANVIIANTAGITVRRITAQINNGEIELDFNGLSKGLYIVFLKTEKENIEFKIVKK